MSKAKMSKKLAKMIIDKSQKGLSVYGMLGDCVNDTHYSPASLARFVDTVDDIILAEARRVLAGGKKK